MKAKIKTTFLKLVQPKSAGRGTARQEFILNILLLSSIVLALVASLVVVINFFSLGEEFDGVSPYAMLVILGVFVALYFFSRHRHPRFSAYLLIIIFLAVTANISIKWGALLPQAGLMYALIIVIAGVVISSRAAFGFTVLTGIFLSIVAHLQDSGRLVYDGTWQREPPDLGDALMAWAILGVISVVLWLSNREINKPL